MSEPYVGEIRMFAGNFAPQGWMFCDGQQLAIAENETLFQLIGTTYGGDGMETFNLPNFQSRVPVHMGTGPDGVTYPLAQMAGTEQETLTVQQTPTHTHQLTGSTTVAGSEAPANALTGQTEANLYGQQPPLQQMNSGGADPAGGSQPHENVQPFLCVNYIISMFGIFPSPT